MPSLEELIPALTSALTAHTIALNANTEAHGGKAPAKGAGAATPGKKTAGTVTAEMVKAAIMGLKDASDSATARSVMMKAAKVREIAQIKPGFYVAVMDAVTEKMNEIAEAAAGNEDDAPADDDEL